MDLRDDLEVQLFLFGENEALNNVTIGMNKQDNIECCVCLNYHYGVKLPNCNHFLCPKCYYKIYNGFVSNNFKNENIEPKYPEKIIYPYQNKDENRKLFYEITKDDTYLEWFIYENEDLYNSVKLNSEFVSNLDMNLKFWFKNNTLIKQYDTDLIQYETDLIQYDTDVKMYNKLYETEKENNAKKNMSFV